MIKKISLNYSALTNYVAFRPEQARANAEKMIGKYLVTKQSGAEGKICNTVMITTRMFPRKEFYLAVMMERSFGVICISSININTMC